MSDAERPLAACARARDPYAAVGSALGELVGWRLFTVMALDHARGEAARVHSSAPEAYPAGGRKPLGDLTAWGAHVIEGRRSWIARTMSDIQAAFPDHEAIAALGCASCLNVPVLDGGTVVGTVNLLHAEGWYEDRHTTVVSPFATFLAGPLGRWASSS